MKIDAQIAEKSMVLCTEVRCQSNSALQPWGALHAENVVALWLKGGVWGVRVPMWRASKSRGVSKFYQDPPSSSKVTAVFLFSSSFHPIWIGGGCSKNLEKCVSPSSHPPQLITPLATPPDLITPLKFDPKSTFDHFWPTYHNLPNLKLTKSNFTHVLPSPDI